MGQKLVKNNEEGCFRYFQTVGLSVEFDGCKDWLFYKSTLLTCNIIIMMNYLKFIYLKE